MGWKKKRKEEKNALECTCNRLVQKKKKKILRKRLAAIIQPFEGLCVVGGDTFSPLASASPTVMVIVVVGPGPPSSAVHGGQYDTEYFEVLCM